MDSVSNSTKRSPPRRNGRSSNRGRPSASTETISPQDARFAFELTGDFLRETAKAVERVPITGNQLSVTVLRMRQGRGSRRASTRKSSRGDQTGDGGEQAAIRPTSRVYQSRMSISSPVYSSTALTALREDRESGSDPWRSLSVNVFACPYS
jgi:hypothetical protein